MPLRKPNNQSRSALKLLPLLTRLSLFPSGMSLFYWISSVEQKTLVTALFESEETLSE